MTFTARCEEPMEIGEINIIPFNDKPKTIKRNQKNTDW